MGKNRRRFCYINIYESSSSKNRVLPVAPRQFVLVRFWDHVVGSRELALTETIGELVEETADKIVLATWLLYSQEMLQKLDYGDFNNEFTTLAKSTIIQILPLKMSGKG